MTDFEEIGARWMKQAVHDPQIAKKNISIGGFDSAAFYSHQSVEKLLKGISQYPVVPSQELMILNALEICSCIRMR